ncbi:helix-turn-helix domain-containing protein [Porticoccaceae bacterium]|nr:helix-turn-helix domain-containing protein [Porticoccaceae bacterium]
MNFYKRLNKALTDAHKSQTDLATHLGVSPQAVQQWCKADGTTPRANKVEKIARYLNANYSWLATGEDIVNGVSETAAKYAQNDRVLEKLAKLTTEQKQSLNNMTAEDIADKITHLKIDQLTALQMILDSWDKQNGQSD